MPNKKNTLLLVLASYIAFVAFFTWSLWDTTVSTYFLRLKTSVLPEGEAMVYAGIITFHAIIVGIVITFALPPLSKLFIKIHDLGKQSRVTLIVLFLAMMWMGSFVFREAHVFATVESSRSVYDYVFVLLEGALGSATFTVIWGKKFV